MVQGLVFVADEGGAAAAEVAELGEQVAGGCVLQEQFVYFLLCFLQDLLQLFGVYGSEGKLLAVHA